MQDLLRVNALTRCGLNALFLLLSRGTPASYRCSLSLWIIRTNGRLLGGRRGPFGLCGVPRPRPRPDIKWYGKKADFSTTLLRNLSGGTSWFSQQTDEYLFNRLLLILQSGDTKLAQLVFYNSLLDQCYTHFYISQETSCLA